MLRQKSGHRSELKGGKINGDIRGIGVCGSDGCEMIMDCGDLRGFFVAEYDSVILAVFGGYCNINGDNFSAKFFVFEARFSGHFFRAYLTATTWMI